MNEKKNVLQHERLRISPIMKVNFLKNHDNYLS